MEKAKKISLFVLLLLSISFASAIGNEVPIQIQVTDSDGDIQTGTFTFTINISNSITCSPVLFSNVTTLTTDARGIVSYNIQLDLDFSEQYYLCYYRDDVLKETKTIGVTPYAFRSNISNHLVSTNNYEMANLTLGQKITFAFDEIIDNIVDGWIRITGNLNVTENLTVEGNAIIDKYLHLYPGANQNLANEFSDDGAIFVGGDAFFNKGASLQSRQYGYGLMVQDYNIPGIINRTSDTGEFTGATQYFCDYTTGFTQTDIDENRAVVFGHDALYPLVSDIKLLINSDCVELDIATSDVLPDFNTSYYVMQSPTLFITDGGHAHISIGEHDNSHLMITTANGTGADNVLIDDVSGANNRRSLGILTDSKDYTGISGLNVLMYSSTGVNEITSQALKLSGDAKGFNNSDLRFIDIDLISAGSENTVIGMNIEGSITHIINQGKAQVLDSAWYDDTTSTTNMTDYFTSLTNDATLFEDQNSYIYIGNSHNFTRVGVSLMTGASHTIIPEYYYCNSAGNWDTLNGITDTTDGFTKAGSIIFINPSDRGVCNKEVDGTPFADAADYTYIAIKRTRNLLPTSPVENLISIGGGATNFFLDEDVIRLVPVASPPYTCTSAYQGAIYSDSATVELLWCDGTSWQAFAETSDVTNHNKLSGIQGGTATEYYHLTSAQHSLATGDNYLLNTGDTATGNYTFDTDTFFIDSSNNRVGIGTSSPGTELEVNGDIGIGRVAGGYTFRESVGGGVRAGIYSDATNELIFKYGADVEGMRIDASGDVGIGTASPLAKLHSHESSVLGGTTGNNQLISEFSTPGGSTGNTVRHREYAYRDATGTAWTTWRLHDAISVDSSFATPGTDTKVWWERDPQHDIQSWGNAASTYMTINAGNVGIGTSSPVSALDIGTAAPSGLLTFTGTHGGGGEGIAYEDSGGVSRYALNFPGSDIVAFSNRASNGVVQIRANTATAGSGGEVTAIVVEDNEIQLLPSGGNVGIGTSSPSSTLEVNGGVNIGGTGAIADNNLYVVGDVSALTFTDRTPFYDGDALNEIVLISGIDGEINHSSLPEFVKVEKNVTIYEVQNISEEVFNETSNKTENIIVEKEVAVGVEPVTERNLGNMISVLVKGIQELFNWNTEQDNEIIRIKQCTKNSSSWETYQNCVNPIEIK